MNLGYLPPLFPSEKLYTEEKQSDSTREQK